MPRVTGDDASLRLSLGHRDGHRVVTAVAVAGTVAAAVLAVAGLPPLDIHGPLHFAGIMDPFCGGTRAVRYAALGQWAQSWRYNPLGVPLLVGGVLVVGRAAVGVLTGWWINDVLGWTPRRRRVVLAGVALLAVALQVRQQQRVDLLVAR